MQATYVTSVILGFADYLLQAEHTAVHYLADALLQAAHYIN